MNGNDFSGLDAQSSESVLAKLTPEELQEVEMILDSERETNLQYTPDERNS